MRVMLRVPIRLLAGALAVVVAAQGLLLPSLATADPFTTAVAEVDSAHDGDAHPCQVSANEEGTSGTACQWGCVICMTLPMGMPGKAPDARAATEDSTAMALTGHDDLPEPAPPKPEPA